MGRSVYTDRNPSLIRELFTHEVVNEDAPANMKLALDNYSFFTLQDNHGPPTHFVKKSPNETTTTNYIEEKRVVIMYPSHL